MIHVFRNPAMVRRQEADYCYRNPVGHLAWEYTVSSVAPYYWKEFQ